MSIVRHATVVAALHRAADVRAELFELHLAARERLDARQLREDAAAWAGRLHAAGARRGDPIPILLPTGADFVAAFLGVQWLGAIPAPLATPMTFGSTTRFLEGFAAVVEDADARLAIATPRLRDALTSLPVRHRLRDVLVPHAGGGPTNAPTPDVSPEDAALLQYTSGTTGRPKGVVVSQRALVANAAAIAEALALRESDVGVSWLPLFHDMGLVGVLMTAICHPYRVHLLSPQSFAMRPRRWLELASDVAATITAAPNFAYQLCASREPDARSATPIALDALRAALNGSELVHAETLERFDDAFGPYGFSRAAWRPVYGLAENTLAVTIPASGPHVVSCDREAWHRLEVRPPGHTEVRSVAVGRAVAGTEVRVKAPLGQIGEIQVRGASRMDGYFRRPEQTAAVLDEGWFRTGDLGFERDGQLHVVGRAKETIVKGGRNVHPPDVERVACQRAEVRAAAAWGAHDARLGTERLCVRVETREHDPVALGRLEAGIRGDVLASLGVRVDEVSFCAIGALPRTTSGKVRRGALAS
ncbi:MAG: AMP-binding protein [Sandaracinus sp.]|nr:AMP-binding protein [Sandaracinus sp.]MCB9625311.1 AMP-binding protein [Sandaracinus sp.]